MMYQKIIKAVLRPFVATFLIGGTLLTFNQAHSENSGYEIVDSYGGGALVQFNSGCKITYDQNARRGAHSGRCSNYEYNEADNAAYRYLRGGAGPKQ